MAVRPGKRRIALTTSADVINTTLQQYYMKRADDSTEIIGYGNGPEGIFRVTEA